MKKKILLLVFTFFLWTLIFVLQKPVFLLAYGGIADVFSVMWHGLPLDFSMSGYLTVIPALVLLISCIPFKPLYGKKASKWLMLIVGAWSGVAALLVALAFVSNLALYGYWRFPLDSTPIFFITSSPKDAMASVEWWQALLGIIAIVVVVGIISLAFHLLWRKFGGDVFMHKPTRWQWLPVLLLTALLFLPIRGGVTVSTMNTGKVYFSYDQELNHAAVNPLFSFMESMTHQEDFGEMYRFMNDRKAHEIAYQLMPKLFHFDDLCSTTTRPSQIIKDSLRIDNMKDYSGPDIYLVILESFSDTLTKQPNVTPNLNRLKKEGAYFSNFYANGFRTDRGLVSILLGYPAPGAVSLMKYPRITSHCFSIAQQLHAYGYDRRYYYGGDADFTNMRSFLIGQDFLKITEDKDFPVSSRLSKWGVPDHLLFQRVEKDIASYNSRQSLFAVIQTSSSHEPFDVPYHRLKDKVLNAFSYTDNCLGQFISFLKKSPRWKKSLVIFVPDHLGAWPEDADNFAAWRYHIPMIWVGGAVKKPMVVDTYGSQQDIAATLFGELGIENAYMKFSKDLLNQAVKHYAYFMPNDGFGYKTGTFEVIYDNKQRHTIVNKGNNTNAVKQGQALLQVLFDDIANKQKGKLIN